jgi:hypothetical protein
LEAVAQDAADGTTREQFMLKANELYGPPETDEQKLIVLLAAGSVVYDRNVQVSDIRASAVWKECK